MRLSKKIFLGVIGAALLVIAVYQGVLHVRYRMYQGYKDYLTDQPVYEPGRAFTPMADARHTVDDMATVCENDVLALFVNEQTAEVAVLDKRTGIVTYTNPTDADSDPVANKANKDMLKSQLVVEYYNTDRIAGQFDSFDDAVKDGRFTLETIEQGLRCIYTIGAEGSSTGLVPIYITEDRLQQFAALLSEREAKYITTRYLPSKTASDSLELSESARSGLATLRNLNEYFAKAGYTEQDYEADMLASGVEGAVPIRFVIPLEYRLDGDGLVVSILTDEIQEYGGGRIVRIQMLRYFGAAGMEDSGYLLVPNGSGSLIRFNNGKTLAEEYSQYIYGQDLPTSDYVSLANYELARLPVFGLSRSDQTILAIIESGDALAMVNAGVSGKLNAYNYAFASFTLRGYSSLAMFGTTGNEANLPVVERDLYKTELSVRYCLTDEGGYSGMAAYLRDYWQAKGVLPERSADEPMPLYLDLIGSVTADRFFMGIKYQGLLSMTTLEQAEEIVSSLAEAGVKNQVVNYQGWQSKGYYHGSPNNTRLSSALGSRADLAALTKHVESLGGKLFADAAFQHVSFENAKGFNSMMESSHFYAGGVAWFGQINPVTYNKGSSIGYRDTLYDLLSPKFLDRYVGSFLSGMKRYDVTGYSLRDLADALHSDRRRTEFIDRQQALSIVSAQLQALSDSGQELLASGGNLYALSVCDDLINVPLSHNDFFIVDEEIPFYQMVIHGSLRYAGPAINLEDMADTVGSVLRHIEFGASPHFTFTYENASDMKYTGANRLYATTFSIWRDTAVELYTQIEQALAPVAGQAMVAHEILDSGLRRVSYENGVVFVINRTDRTITYKGTPIEPNSYLREGAQP